MARNIRKSRPASRQRRSVSKPRQVRSRPSMPKRAALRVKIAPRLKTNVIRRSTNPRRVQQRAIKRAAVRQVMQKTQSRPRPVARPVSRPRKAMPKTPSPVRSVRRVSRPRPQPASRRSGAILAGSVAAAAATAGVLMALNIASAHPEISTEISSLQTSLADLQSRGGFGKIANEVSEIDTTLSHVLSLLESAREKGYVYQGDLEDIAFQAMDRWQTILPQLETGINQQSQIVQNNLISLDPQVRRLNATLASPRAATSILRNTESQVNQYLWDLNNAERTLKNIYNEVEADIRELNSRLTRIHWALDQLKEAKFDLGSGEDMVMAVSARWDKKGKDDPEGILYLLNKRLVFERKEKVATKKVLFITTASELIQEVILDKKLEDVSKVKASNKGIFGHQDYLELMFAESRSGKVVFHLNGQDSEYWMHLLERTKNGDIEEERTSGSGISFADLTGPITSADILAIQNEVNELQDEMMLKETQAEIAELENKTHTLERELASLRARGYAVEKTLEADMTILAAQWERIKGRADTTLKHQVSVLSEQMTTIQRDLAKLVGRSTNLTAARPIYIQLKSSIASAEARADAAEDTVLDQYDEYADEIDSLSAHLEWVGWMLDAIATASFRLMATESGVSAVEAVWQRTGLEPENGILFLTDQRLLWEDRVGDYELKIAVPLQQVSEVKEEYDEETGQEYLVFNMDSTDAPVPLARLKLALPVADDWEKMVGRARAGDYVSDRAVALDESEINRVRNAPEQCSNCGAAFTGPVLRGQTEITCEYCGVATRI